MKERDSTVATVEVTTSAQKWRRRRSGLLFAAIFAMCSYIGTANAGLACLSNPCVNGVCMDDLNSTYSCYCIDGFTGVQCQTNWDECWSSPCKNGGSCVDGIAEYNCSCPEGFIGANCEIDFNECDSNPCHNNATCLDGPNGFLCSCLPGYNGTFCEYDIAVCNSTEDTRCSNGGVCVEGLGMSFSCQCTPGWEGKLCDAEINECTSHPCENGGLCIDLHADFSCACTFGYTGKRCESEIELCSNNPCTNNALCMMEAEIWRCYCVPDYHGEKCQYQYDECLLGPRCMNGGTCIDGVDNFTCSCPPSLTGVLCECLILDNGEYDCQYIRPTPITHITTTFLSYNNRTTSESVQITDSIITTEKILPGITTETIIPKITTEDDNMITNVPTTIQDQSTAYYTPFDTTLHSKETPFVSQSSLESSTIQTTSSYDVSSLSNTENDDVRETPTSSFETSTENFVTQTYTFGGKTAFPDDQTISHVAKTATPEDETSTSDISTSITRITSESIPTTRITDVGTTKDVGGATDIDTTTDHYESSTSGWFYTTLKTITDFMNITQVPLVTTSRNIEETSDVTHHNRNTSTEVTTELSTTKETLSYSTNIPIFTTWRDVETFSTITNMFESTTPSTTTSGDCSLITCFNGGSCVHSSEGPKCVCKFDFDGPLCEEKVGIVTAAFSGDSYLTHKLHNPTGIRVQLKVKTLSTEGLILFANIGPETYMCLYLVKGLLKFKFSCGYQTMLLSELEMPINNGYELKVKAVLDFIDNRRHCNATLHINDTLAMSGGQIVGHSLSLLSRDSYLHLGAIPDGFELMNHAPKSIDAFTGCMLGLQIDGKPRYIFKDATDGFEIKECSSLACLSNPCLNGGTCDEINDIPNCRCANGYLGKYCERSVCRTNPCQFGGTCIEHPGSGFLCLCPLGKHGLYCEHNLEIAQLSFSAMVGGLSSYAVYQLPKNLVLHGIEIQFRIQPSNMDQISLLAFMGQSGNHDIKSDHLAITFVKGYIMLTWNLGNGPRRIFTSRPITSRGNRPHLIKVGRIGRSAWLSVDNMQNITGNAPGNLLTLDALPLLYLGGHESANFSTLPHDLPLHGGFSGCIWDLWVGAIGSRNNNGVSWSPVRGRAVGQCSVTQCHPMICHNGGACLHHAATYSCLCSQGWFGPLCTSPQNPCDAFNNKCSLDSTCVPTVRGYQCDCPAGKAGHYCDRSVELTDVSFSGTRSYIKLNPITIGDVHFILEFEVRPMHPKGILFYADTHDGCFVSLSLQGGLLEYRWAGFEWGGKMMGSQTVMVVRSGVVLSLGSWHSVRAGRYGRKLFLWVDGTMTMETLATHQFFTTFNTSIFIGGVNDLSSLPIDVSSGHAMSFTGCMRRVMINARNFPLNNENIMESRNIDDCDGDVCGGDICWNGGTCIIEHEYDNSTAKCVCPYPYTGDQCMEKIPCRPGECNKGKCVQDMCICPNGWEGHSCENQVKIGTPQFRGNSYMMIDDNKLKSPEKQLKSNKIRYKRSANYISVNFTTAQSDGLLLWGEMNNDKFISVGLEGGYLKLSWTLPQRVTKRLYQTDTKQQQQPRTITQDTEIYKSNSIKLLQAGKISNGDWHVFQFKYQRGNVSVTVDDKVVYEESGQGYDVNQDDVVMYLGGLPYNISTTNRTRGLYSSNFVGCIGEVSFGENGYSITNFADFESENVETCQLL